MDVIDDCWDEDIYDDNCPDEEYDYEANEMERPEDIDVDNTYFEDEDGNIMPDRRTIRDEMARMATEGFREGWENEYYSDEE